MKNNKKYHPSLYTGLVPKSKKFLGGLIQEIDVLTLEEAAKMASKHAGAEITQRDFLRASGHGKILLLAIIRRTARVKRYDSQNEFEVQSGQLVRLPIGACRDLAEKDFAKWRTVEDFDHTGHGPLLRCYTEFALADDEPDFETITSDCRIWGTYVHALADAFIQMPPQATPEPQQSSEPAPMVADSASNAPAWTVRKPLRIRGYTAPLHRLLAAANREGKPCPTARDVLEEWRSKAPAEIAKMLPDGFDYYDAQGTTKPADLEAVGKAIKRITSAR